MHDRARFYFEPPIDFDLAENARIVVERGTSIKIHRRGSLNLHMNALLHLVAPEGSLVIGPGRTVTIGSSETLTIPTDAELYHTNSTDITPTQFDWLNRVIPQTPNLYDVLANVSLEASPCPAPKPKLQACEQASLDNGEVFINRLTMSLYATAWNFRYHLLIIVLWLRHFPIEEFG